MNKLIAFIKKHIITTAIAAIIIILLYTLLTVKSYNYFIESKEKQKSLIEQLIESDGWKQDGCKNNTDCQSCKRDLQCLQCMHDCYNRHGDAGDRENPYRKKATACNDECWEKIYWESPDIDFGIPPIKKGK